MPLNKETKPNQERGKERKEEKEERIRNTQIFFSFIHSMETKKKEMCTNNKTDPLRLK